MKTEVIHWYSSLSGEQGIIPIGNYPAGEPLIEYHNERTITRILLRSMSMLGLMGGLFFVDALIERGCQFLQLVLPFVPGARQDRLNSSGDFLFTAKSVAKEINARHFNKVIVVDPHSEVISALIDRCEVIHAVDCLGREPLHQGIYGAVVSPDAGAEKRAAAIARALKVPLLHGWKSRDIATGKISGFGLEQNDVKKRLLVVDDICDGGGTFLGLAEVLKKNGQTADLYITHGIFSQGLEKLRAAYLNVFCTDSIIHETKLNFGFNTIEVCNTLLTKGSL